MNSGIEYFHLSYKVPDWGTLAFIPTSTSFFLKIVWDFSY